MKKIEAIIWLIEFIYMKKPIERVLIICNLQLYLFESIFVDIYNKTLTDQ